MQNPRREATAALEAELETALGELEMVEQRLSANPQNPDGLQRSREQQFDRLRKTAHALALCDLADYMADFLALNSPREQGPQSRDLGHNAGPAEGAD